MKTRAILIAAVLLLASAAFAQDWALKTLEQSPRHGEWVTIKAGSRNVSAFVVYPESKQKAPVVIVIHEIFGICLQYDGQYFYRALRHVVEYPNIAYSKAELRSGHPAQALDPTLAGPSRLVSQVLLQCVTDRRPERCAKQTEIFDRLRRQDNLIAHSG